MLGVTEKYKRQFLSFALLAFLLGSFVPQGFMPVFDDQGKIAIEICSSDGTKTVYIDSDEDEADHQDNVHNECPYAFAFVKDQIVPQILRFSPLKTEPQSPKYNSLEIISLSVLIKKNSQGPPFLS